MILRTALAAATFAALAVPASAAPVAYWTTSDSTSYAVLNSFEGTGTLADGTVITNQFSASGITFTGSAPRANMCGPAPQRGFNPQLGHIGDNYIGTVGTGCFTDSVQDNFSMKFSADLTELAMDLNNYNESRTYSFQILNDGVVVADFLAASLQYFGLPAVAGDRLFYKGVETAGIFKISGGGAVFDEVRFIERVGGSEDFVFFDNVRYNLAGVNTVAEPSVLLLAVLGIGVMAAVGVRP